MPLPPAPYINEFDPLRQESNEEFIARLKNMGKSNVLHNTKKLKLNYIFLYLKDSMEKFNQLARRFSMRKDTTNHIGKYSKEPW